MMIFNTLWSECIKLFTLFFSSKPSYTYLLWLVALKDLRLSEFTLFHNYGSHSWRSSHYYVSCTLYYCYQNLVTFEMVLDFFIDSFHVFERVTPYSLVNDKYPQYYIICKWAEEFQFNCRLLVLCYIILKGLITNTFGIIRMNLKFTLSNPTTDLPDQIL